MRTSKPIARLAVLVALVACSSAVPTSSLISVPSTASPGASASPTAVPTPVPPPPPTAGPTAIPTPVPPPPAAVPTAVPTPVPPPPPPPGGSGPVILAAGDIATSGSGASETALILQSLPGATVLTLGDNAYPDGLKADFEMYYGPTWGIAKDRTRPAMGNHDYNCCADAAGARGYFGFQSVPLYYTYPLGTWKIIALDAGICYDRLAAACDAGSAQEQWLKAQLATNPTACTLLYWHQARWSSGSNHGSDDRMKAFWDDAVAARADIVLSGHDHLYERFAPMNAQGAPSATGVREFVVGTGGAGFYGFNPTPLPASQFRDNTHLGVLKLTLRVGAYDWAFLPVGGGPALDTGSGTCN